jgi:hypothetical protein
MSAVINISMFKKIGNWIAKNQKDARIVPLIWGKHGIGKTQVTEEIAKTAGYNCVILNLANQTTEDLLGFPDGNGGYLLPDWVVSADREDKRSYIDTKLPTLYFLDEVNRAPKYILQAMFNFINEGRIHTHRISKDDVIFAAANPADIDYEVTDFEDKAFLSRFAHFYLEPNSSEFLSYLQSKKAHPGIITALKLSPEVVDYSIDSEYKITVQPDNRSIDRIVDMMNIMDGTPEYNEFGEEIITAMVGSDFAATIIASMKEHENMSPEKILTVSDKSEFDFEPQQLDVITALSGGVTGILKERYTKDSEESPFSEDEIKSLMVYLDFIPRDAEFAFIKDMMNATNNLVLMRTMFGMEYLQDLFETSGK